MDLVGLFGTVIGIACSAVPGSLPTIATSTLAVGVRRMTHRTAVKPPLKAGR
jgi:magnesium-transporting ATPase (P-type)